MAVRQRRHVQPLNDPFSPFVVHKIRATLSAQQEVERRPGMTREDEHDEGTGADSGILSALDGVRGVPRYPTSYETLVRNAELRGLRPVHIGKGTQGDVYVLEGAPTPTVVKVTADLSEAAACERLLRLGTAAPSCFPRVFGVYLTQHSRRPVIVIREMLSPLSDVSELSVLVARNSAYFRHAEGSGRYSGMTRDLVAAFHRDFRLLTPTARAAVSNFFSALRDGIRCGLRNGDMGGGNNLMLRLSGAVPEMVVSDLGLTTVSGTALLPVLGNPSARRK